MEFKPALPGLKVFRAEGCLSYLVWDRATGLSALIDPNVQLLSDYRDYLVDHHLKLSLLLETHTHADHFSATHLLHDQYKAEVGMSHRTRSARVTRRLVNGEKIELGAMTIEVLETPGHTPDAVSYYVHGLVFTGDTLLIGSSGRTDFPGADPVQQYHSIHSVLGKLPDATVVFPGHDYNNLIFSTIGIEKEKNDHWQISSQDAFVKMKKAEVHGPLSSEISERIEYNLAARPEGGNTSQFGGAATACGSPKENPVRASAISVDKYVHKLEEHAPDTTFLDVRETDEYREGHMEGTENLPLSEVALHLSKLRQAKRIYISCLSGRRSAMVAQTLSYVGLPDAVNVSGGYQAWTQAGYPVAKPRAKTMTESTR